MAREAPAGPEDLLQEWLGLTLGPRAWQQADLASDGDVASWRDQVSRGERNPSLDGVAERLEQRAQCMDDALGRRHVPAPPPVEGAWGRAHTRGRRL